jgi:hypothetical protein
MPRRQRLAVAVLFSFGTIVTVAGVVRTWFIYRSLFGEWDQTWHAYPLWIAAAIEIDLGVVRRNFQIERLPQLTYQICASAPVLRPLLAKIPFNLSGTWSHSFSMKKSTPYASKGSARRTPAGSHNAPESKRKAEAIRAIPELNTDRGKSYELKAWDDVERSRPTDNVSEEAMLETSGHAPQGKGLRGLWGKVVSNEETSRKRDDMTITRTDEVELRVSTLVSRSTIVALNPSL